MTAGLYWSKTGDKTYYYIIIPISAKEFGGYWNSSEKEQDYCGNLVIFKFNLCDYYLPPHLGKINWKRRRSRLFVKSPLKFPQKVSIIYTSEIYDMDLNFSCNIILGQDFCFILKYLIGEISVCKPEYSKGTTEYLFLKFILNKISQE